MRKTSLIRQGRRPTKLVCPTPVSETVTLTCRRDRAGHLYGCEVVPSPLESHWRRFLRAADEAAPTVAKYVDIGIAVGRAVRKP